MKDEEVTRVVFRKYPNDDVIALFIDKPVCASNWYYCASYVSTGQHAAADERVVIKQTKPATPKEYESLRLELESVPYEYNLRPLKRIPSDSVDKRIAAWKEWHSQNPQS